MEIMKVGENPLAQQYQALIHENQARSQSKQALSYTMLK